MLIADFRERCSSNKVKSWLKISNYTWLFEILVYHLMLRLIRTSKEKGRWIAYCAANNHLGKMLRTCNSVSSDINDINWIIRRFFFNVAYISDEKCSKLKVFLGFFSKLLFFQHELHLWIYYMSKFINTSKFIIIFPNLSLFIIRFSSFYCRCNGSVDKILH